MRVAIFCFLGPPLGAIVMLGLALSIGSPGEALAILPIAPFFLLFSYLPGFAPAILTSQVDDYFSDKLALWPRVAVAGLTGAVVSFAWLALIVGLSGYAMSPSAEPAAGGANPAGILIGAIPAAVCSWLSDKWERQGSVRGTAAGPASCERRP